MQSNRKTKSKTFEDNPTPGNNAIVCVNDDGEIIHDKRICVIQNV